MGLSQAELAATFEHPGVADAYQHRPPYPDEVFTRLEQLVTDRPRQVLDIGAGEGALARRSRSAWTASTRSTSRRP